MILQNKELYFRMISFSNRTFLPIISPHLNDLPYDSKNYLNLSRAFTYESFSPRQGVWETPWTQKIAVEHEMPVYDPNFSLTFSEVTDNRSHEIKKIINDTDKKIVIFYSGGIDSTVCVSSIIKNFNKEELSKVSIALSADSIIENPNFYNKFIKNKINTFDSSEKIYSDLVDMGYICISCDLGDAIFGTELGTKMYSQIDYLCQELSDYDKKIISSIQHSISDPDVHYSKFKPIIVAYLNRCLSSKVKNLTDIDQNFGNYFYEKFDKNIKTSSVTVHSLHDFYWWIIFNIKYFHCAFRPGILYSTGPEKKNLFEKKIINWYGNKEYQLWSMKNNNNGQKIKGRTQSSYKWAAREYIYDLDHNDWYFYHKIKIGSLPFVIRQNYKKYFKEFDPIFGMDTDYKMLYMGSKGVDELIVNSLYNFKETV